MPLTFAGAHPAQRLPDTRRRKYYTQENSRRLINAREVAEKNFAGKSITQAYERSVLGMLHTLDPHSSFYAAKSGGRFKTSSKAVTQASVFH